LDFYASNLLSYSNAKTSHSEASLRVAETVA